MRLAKRTTSARRDFVDARIARLQRQLATEKSDTKKSELRVALNDWRRSTILMEYLGFTPNNKWREYSFQVRYAAEDVRDFTLTILNEAFTSHRVRYQDAPDVCSAKLRRELSANASHRSHTNFAISDSDLADYKAGHPPRTFNRPYASKGRSTKQNGDFHALGT
jgi:hypothetical protein